MQEQETVNINTTRSELWSLSFRDLFYKYVRFLPLFLLSVAFALFIAYVYLRYATPIYSGGGTLLIKSEQGGGGRNDKFEDVFVNSRTSNIQNEIEVLKSRALMERVVNRLGLQFSYLVQGKIKSANIYKQGPFLVEAFQLADSSQAFSLKIKFINDHEFRVNDDKTVIGFGQYFKNANGIFRLNRNLNVAISKEYNVSWQPAYSAAGAYAGSLQITPKTPGTGILIISMQSTNPQMCADIINKLMQEYGGYSIEQKIKSSDQILTFIEERLTDYGRKLDSVQKIYLDLQIKYNLFDAQLQSTNYFNNISAADKTVSEQRIKLNVVDMVNEYLTDKKNEFNKVIVPSSLGLDDVTLNGLIAAYNKAQLDRQLYVESNTPPDNPSVKEINGQIEQLRISIRENLKNIKASIQLLIGETKTTGTETESQLKTLPAKTKELAEIKQQVEAYQTLYGYLQTKKEETAISRASTIPNSEIVERAFASNVPVKPSRRSIQILAALLGIGLPALLIFIGEILNDKVTTRFDIERITTTPILGEVGHSYSNKVLIVNKTTRSMVAEQFRIIRSNLQYIINKVDKSILLVTSSFSGEGKSYISINMGAVLALAGKKTIILEFDIRKPKVLSGLGLSKGPGITNYLVGKTKDLNELVKPVPDQENLFVLGCGPVPPNPAELLLSQRVEDMFDWLRQNFEMILVDTAPIGMVSDAMTLSKFADATLYLVRQGHTFKKQVGLIDEFYQQNKLPKVSIIINDVKMKPGYGYYGYGRYGYGYGYGYGSYYEEETPPKNIFEKALSRMDIRRLFRRSGKN